METTTHHRLRNLHELSASLFLMLLVIADAAFIALHVIKAVTPWLPNPAFSLETDGGYAEVYEYVKLVWTVVLLVYVCRVRRSISYAVWGLFFMYLLCDDTLQLREAIGSRIAEHLSFKPPLHWRLLDFGKMVVSAMAGSVLFTLIACIHQLGSHAFKKMTQDLLLLTLGLVFFGVVVDLMHAAIHPGKTVEIALSLIEEGGESIFFSLMLWYVFLVAIRRGNTVSYLCDVVYHIIVSRRWIPATQATETDA
jgi:hypothetical protein